MNPAELPTLDELLARASALAADLDHVLRAQHRDDLAGRLALAHAFGLVDQLEEAVTPPRTSGVAPRPAGSVSNAA
jgi:hypothetical protein